MANVIKSLSVKELREMLRSKADEVKEAAQKRTDLITSTLDKIVDENLSISVNDLISQIKESELDGGLSDASIRQQVYKLKDSKQKARNVEINFATAPREYHGVTGPRGIACERVLAWFESGKACLLTDEQKATIKAALEA
jgi:hypothetical protein